MRSFPDCLLSNFGKLQQSQHLARSQDTRIRVMKLVGNSKAADGDLHAECCKPLASSFMTSPHIDVEITR